MFYGNSEQNKKEDKITWFIHRRTFNILFTLFTYHLYLQERNNKYVFTAKPMNVLLDEQAVWRKSTK